MKADLRTASAQSIETALSLADGLVVIDVLDGESSPSPSTSRARSTASALPELQPRIFSFNSPHGACPRCNGLGAQQEIDPDLLVPDPTLSIGEGALVPWSIGQLELLRGRHPGDRRPLGDRPRHALARPHRGGAGPLPLRHRRRAHLRHVPQPDGPQALVHARLRGHRPEPRAPLPRDRLGAAARAHRGVHELRARARSARARA